MPASPDRAPELGSAQPEARPNPPRPSAGVIDVGPRGELVWDTLRETWLTHNIVSNQETHLKGGYRWDASDLVPVMLLDEEGDPYLAFARG